MKTSKEIGFFQRLKYFPYFVGWSVCVWMESGRERNVLSGGEEKADNERKLHAAEILQI